MAKSKETKIDEPEVSISLTMHQHYFNIAKKNHDDYRKISEDIIALSEGDLKRNDLEMEKRQAVVIGITFYAMSLESFLYYYGTIHFDKGISKNKLNGMSFLDKYLKLPKLITGKEPSKKEPLRLIKSLIDARKYLVHYKPKPVGGDWSEGEPGELEDAHDNVSEKLNCAIRNSCVAVREVLREIDQLHRSVSEQHGNKYYDSMFRQILPV